MKARRLRLRLRWVARTMAACDQRLCAGRAQEVEDGRERGYEGAASVARRKEWEWCGLAHEPGRDAGALRVPGRGQVTQKRADAERCAVRRDARRNGGGEGAGGDDGRREKEGVRMQLPCWARNRLSGVCSCASTTVSGCASSRCRGAAEKGRALLRLSLGKLPQSRFRIRVSQTRRSATAAPIPRPSHTSSAPITKMLDWALPLWIVCDHTKSGPCMIGSNNLEN